MQPAAKNKRPTLIIIGSGMATARLLEKLVALEHPYRIVVYGEEAKPSYNRILLSSLLSEDKTEADLPLLSNDWYLRHNIDLRTESPVVSVDRKSKTVTTGSGASESYDLLVFATGSRALIPDIPGSTIQNVMGFRNQQDVQTMNRIAQSSESRGQAIVVGGGLLGLEAAHGLNHLGMKVTLIHRNQWLMNRQLDKTAGEILQRQLEARGINFVMGASPVAVKGASPQMIRDADSERGANNSFQQLLLDTGERIDGDLLVFAAGIQPNAEIADLAGIKSRRAICINDQMQTSAEGIYALGECAELDGQLFGLVAPVWEQAEVLASVLCGDTQTRYFYQDAATQLKVSGIDLFSAGDIAKAEADHCENIVLSLPEQGLYRRLFIQNDQLKAAVLLGDRTNSSWYSDLIKNQTPVSDIRPWLMFGKDYLPEKGTETGTRSNADQTSHAASLEAA